jgi:hypothetical protein
MPHEGDLGEHKGEECGIQELQPEEIRHKKAGKGQNEETQHLKDFVRVIERLSVEQSLLREEPLELGILVHVRVGWHPVKPLALMCRGG